jgi:hypothetical protein
MALAIATLLPTQTHIDGFSTFQLANFSFERCQAFFH